MNFNNTKNMTKVNILFESGQQDETVAPAFEHIMAITLNKSIDIAFIPDTEFNFLDWPPKILCASDEITTKQEANLHTVIGYNICVVGTNSKELLEKGSLALTPTFPELEVHPNVLFFIDKVTMDNIIESIFEVLYDDQNTIEKMNVVDLSSQAFMKYVTNVIYKSDFFIDHYKVLLNNWK